MARKWILTILAPLVLVPVARTQSTAGHFHWVKGQVLHFRVEQITKVTEVAGGT